MFKKGANGAYFLISDFLYVYERSTKRYNTEK